MELRQKRNIYLLNSLQKDIYIADDLIEWALEE